MLTLYFTVDEGACCEGYAGGWRLVGAQQSFVVLIRAEPTAAKETCERGSGQHPSS